MSISNLIDGKRTVYIHLKDTAAQYRFMSDAERAGMTYPDGSAPTEHAAEDIMALHPDGTIAFLGWAGRVRYHHVMDAAVCVDYAEFIGEN